MHWLFWEMIVARIQVIKDFDKKRSTKAQKEGKT